MEFGQEFGQEEFGGSTAHNIDVDIIDQMDAYAALLPPSKLKEYEKEKEKKNKPSLFQKVVSVLSTGETGQAVYDMLDGKNPVAAYGKSIAESISGQGYDKRTYADVLEKLGMKRGALSELMPWLYTDTGKGLKFKKGGIMDVTARGTLGLALDILADPTTYIGGYGLFKRVGLGSVKGLTESGQQVAEGIGKKYYKLASKAATVEDAYKIYEEGSSTLAKKLLSNPDKYFQGLTMFGKEVVPRKVVLGPGRYADKVMQHIPIVNSVYRGAKEGIQDVFQYGADILRSGKKLGDAGEETAQAYLNAKTKFRREADYSVQQLYDSLRHPAKDFWNATSKNEREAARRYIADKIENAYKPFGIKNVDTATLDNMVDILKRQNDMILAGQNASRVGLEKEMMKELSGYLPHIMTPEAKKALSKLNIAKYKGSKAMDYFINPDKSRTLWHFVADDGTVISGNAKSLGLLQYSKPAEEAYLNKRFSKLIKTQDKHLREISTKMNQIDKKKLSVILSSDSSVVEPAEKIQKKLNELGKLSERYEGKANKIGAEIVRIKDELAEGIDNLPDADKYFKDATGKVFTKLRPMSISEINNSSSLKKIMKDAGYEGKNFFETDPFAITLARGQTAIREIEKNNLLREVADKFGIRSDDMKVIKTRNAVTRKTSIKEKYYDVVKDGIRYVDPEIKELGSGILVPDFIVADLKKTVNALSNDDIIHKVLKTYDKTMNIWKSSVYGWFPASHGRNYIGGSFVNFMANPKWTKYIDDAPKVIKGTDDVINLGDKALYKNITYRKVKEELGKRGVFSQTGALDMMDLNKTFNKNFWDKVQKVPIKAGELVEQNLRIPLFLAELSDGKTLDDAIKTVYRFHFDYAPQAATEVERNVLKRIIPFYTWQKNVIPLLFEETIKSPGKMSSFYKAIRDADDGSGNIDRTLLPSYMEEDPAILAGGSAITNLGLPPNQILNFFSGNRGLLGNAWTSVLGMTSPVIKIPIEIRTNFNTFKDKQITEDTNGEFARNYPQAVRDWLEWEDVSFVDKNGKTVSYSRVNPLRKYWLYALPTGRLSTLATMMYGDKEEVKVARFLTGVSSVKVDLEQLKETKEKEYENKLKQIFIDAGIFSEYGTAYKSSKQKLQGR